MAPPGRARHCTAVRVQCYQRIISAHQFLSHESQFTIIIESFSSPINHGMFYVQSGSPYWLRQWVLVITSWVILIDNHHGGCSATLDAISPRSITHRALGIHQGHFVKYPLVFHPVHCHTFDSTRNDPRLLGRHARHPCNGH